MNKLIFGDIEVSKKQFYEGKKAVNLGEADVNKIVVSNTIKENNEASKIFISYMDYTGGIFTPLCIILPQMSGWIKYFENGDKNMSFKIEDEIFIYLKYNEMWNKIKELVRGLKLYSEPIYDDSYIKTKVKTFSEMIKTLLDRDEIPKERIEYLCVVCISMDS